MDRRAVIILALAILLSRSPAVAGDGGDRPVIVRANVFLSDSLIVGDVTSRNLFSEQIVGTVESGLPAVVELLYALVTRENRTVNRGLHVFELHYDVWDDFYSIGGMDSTLRYSSFGDMAGAVERLHDIAIVPLAMVDPNTDYAVEFSIAVHPLRGREKQIVGWVGENIRAGDDTWREQVLNLNDLIQHFFASGTTAAGRSEWYTTGFFNPGRLPIGDRHEQPADSGASSGETPADGPGSGKTEAE